MESDNTLQKLDHSFFHMGSRDQTHMVGFGSKNFYPLSHVLCIDITIFKAHYILHRTIILDLLFIYFFVCMFVF